MRKITVCFIFIFLLNPALIINAQKNSETQTFQNIKILIKDGDEISQKSVSVSFEDDELKIKTTKNSIIKTFKYADIKSAEYSFSKSPRWKTGLGLGATALIFPPILLVAIPLGFTKHRRHWLTIKTENDYAVLKLSKGNRKIFMPTFETKTGITIEPVGEEK